MQDYSTYIQYNEDNSVKVPFGRAAEWYIANHPLLKNRHLCQVRVKSEVHLSSLTTSHPLLIEIHGTHAPLNIIVNLTPKIERLNLLKSVRDNVLLSRRADHRNAKGIKSKLLASMNGANEGTLSQALTNQRTIYTDNKLKQLVARDDRRLKDHIGSWTILHNLIVENLKPKGYILYYQQPNLSFPEDSPQRFYQLTLSDEFWLKNTYGLISLIFNFVTCDYCE